MLALDLLKKPELLTPQSFYVIVGDDVYLRSQAIEAIERFVFPKEEDKIGLTRKSGDSASLADVLDELCTQSFFSPKRMVVLDPAEEFVSKNRVQLEKYAEHPAEGSVLVLAVKTFPASTRLAKILAKSKPGGLLIDAKSPSAGELGPWINARCVELETKIERDAASLLLELIGTEIGILDQELAKLAVACHDGKKSVIRRADVARHVHSGHVESIWNMLDLATTGNMGRALDDLDNLLTAGEPPIKLVAAMASSLRKLHHAGILRARKVPAEEAFREADIKSFFNGFQKADHQHKHLGPGRVNDLPNMLIQTDLELKGWIDLPPRTVLERLIVKLAEPRKD